MAGDRNATAPIGKRGGTLIVEPYEGGPVTQQDTVKCGHCGYQSLWVRGSEKWWSLCTSCGKLRCGRSCCRKHDCVEEEFQLDNMEKGLPVWHRPIVSIFRG